MRSGYFHVNAILGMVPPIVDEIPVFGVRLQPSRLGQRLDQLVLVSAEVDRQRDVFVVEPANVSPWRLPLR
jgi:hypothetical protein